MTAQIGALQVTPFNTGHAAAWKMLNEAWIERHFVIEPKDRATLDEPEGEILSKGGHILMLERDGEAIGCAALMAMEDGGFELAKMAVAETAQGLGAGRKLMIACIETARAAGAHRLYLESNSALTPAITLYRSSGFRDLPSRPTPYARCNVWMELLL